MPQDSWVSCRQELDELISLLLAEPDYIVTDLVEEYDDMAEREPEAKDGKTQKVKVAGSVVGLVENLDNEVSLARCLESGRLTCSSSRLFNTLTPMTRAPTTLSD